MFEYVKQTGFGQYDVRCSKCGFMVQVGTVSFRKKAYEKIDCISCRDLAGPDLKAVARAALSERVQLEELQDQLMTVLDASNVIVLKLGD